MTQFVLSKIRIKAGINVKGNFFLENRTFEVRDLPARDLEPADVLVRVAACGVCGTDVHICDSGKGSVSVVPPVVLGHEFAGVVTQVGSGVTTVRVGDHVTVDPNIYCGKCHCCHMGKKQLCTELCAIGVNRNGGFAEYCVVPEAQCFTVNKDVPLKYAAMAEPLACCLHGIDRAGIAQGDTVCVIGGGFIGLTMVQLAKLAGASRVVLSEPVKMRQEIGRKLGADFVVDPTKENLSRHLAELLGECRANVIIECVGNPAAVNQAIAATGLGTTLLLFSVPQEGSMCELRLDDVFHKELTVIGSIINPDTHGRAAMLINSGVIHFEDMITHSFSMDRVADAINMQKSNDSIKVIVEP